MGVIKLTTKIPIREWARILDVSPECIFHYIHRERLKVEYDPNDKRRTCYTSIENMAKFMTRHPIAFRYYQNRRTQEEYANVFKCMGAYFSKHPRVRTMGDIAEELGVTRNCVGHWVKKGYLELDIPQFLVSQKSYDALFKNYPKTLEYKAMKEAEDQIIRR